MEIHLAIIVTPADVPVGNEEGGGVTGQGKLEGAGMGMDRTGLGGMRPEVEWIGVDGVLFGILFQCDGWS